MTLFFRTILSVFLILMLFGTVSAATPIISFNGTPTSGTFPISVAFVDSSTQSPTGWAWFFGDETYTEPWTLQNESSGWQKRYRHTSVSIPDGSIVLMGGRNADDSLYLNDTWRSVDKGVTWTLQNASSGWSGREDHNSVAMPDGSIVLMGGIGTGGNLNDTWRSVDKGITWTLQNASSGWTARSDSGSVSMHDDSIVLMGGHLDSTGNTELNDTWRSVDKGITWTEQNASSGWTGRSGHISVSMPDASIVLMGGYSDVGGWKNDVWMSSDNGVTWTLQNASSGWLARNQHTSVSMPDASIVLMGGRSYNDVWRSTDNGAIWTEVNTTAGWSAGSQFSSVAIPDGSIVLMGGLRGGCKNDTWRFSPVGSSLQSPSHTYNAIGTYSVALQAFNAGSYNSTRKTGYITVTAVLPPTVTGITPNTGQNTSTISITSLTGTGFNSAVTASGVNLTMTGEANITATSVSWVSATQLTCVFDLTGKKTGVWNLNITNPDGKEGSLANAFTITNVTPSPAPTAAPTTAPSSGGGGGGSSSSIGAGVSGSVQAGETAGFTFTKTAVFEVAVTVKDDTPKMMITVEKKALPRGINEPEQNVYQYQEVTVYWADDSDISKGTLEFGVTKDWLSKNGLTFGDIVMIRYNEETETWEELPTELIGEDSASYLYRATTPGFSLFGIAASEGVTIVSDEKSIKNLDVVVVEETTETATPEETTTPVLKETTPIAQETPKATPVGFAPVFAILISGILLFLKRNYF